MGELVQITGTQNPGAPAQWQVRREGAAAGVTFDTEGNGSFGSSLTVAGVPVTGGAGGDPITSALGLVAQTADPANCHTSLDIPAGALLLVLCELTGASISTLGTWITSAGITSSGVNGLALYTAAGNLVDKTGDMSAAFASTGWSSAALSGGAQAPAAGAYYWAMLSHFSGGDVFLGGMTTPVAIPVINGKRRSLFFTGQASFPATVNLAAGTLNQGLYYGSVS